MGLCLILTVVFELEVDTLRFNSRLVAIQRAVDTILSTESLLCQTSIWRKVRCDIMHLVETPTESPCTNLTTECTTLILANE